MKRSNTDWWIFAGILAVIVATRFVWAIVVYGDVRCAVAECRVVK